MGTINAKTISAGIKHQSRKFQLPSNNNNNSHAAEQAKFTAPHIIP